MLFYCVLCSQLRIVGDLIDNLFVLICSIVLFLGNSVLNQIFRQYKENNLDFNYFFLYRDE